MQLHYKNTTKLSDIQILLLSLQIFPYTDDNAHRETNLIIVLP